MRYFTLLALLFLCSCSHLYAKRMMVARMPAVAPDRELICYKIDAAQFAWGAVSAGASAASGAGSTLIAVFDDRTTQYILVGGSVVFALLAGTSTYASAHYSHKFTAEKCQ